MKNFFLIFARNVAAVFAPKYLVWHGVMIVLTALCVLSGFDFAYFVALRPYSAYLFPAAALGGLVPIVLPAVLLALGFLRRNMPSGRSFTRTALALIQAEAAGLFISSAYKAFTGRAHPILHFSSDATTTLVDISREFHFGFLQGGVFWGWPSSHTTVAFALAAALWVLFPRGRAKSATVRTLAALYALYVGIGVSATIHWFSDFAAGAILGILIGTVVGRSFRRPL